MFYLVLPQGYFHARMAPITNVSRYAMVMLVIDMLCMLSVQTHTHTHIQSVGSVLKVVGRSSQIIDDFSRTVVFYVDATGTSE